MDGLITDPLHASILVVDDEPQNVSLIERILRRAGYQNVRGTTQSAQVAALCREELPDVVLIDLHMPAPNGLAVMEQVRGMGFPLEPYFVVLTGDSTTETKNNALANGARDFIAKPFDRTEVLLRISNLVDMRQMQMRLQMHNLDLEESVRLRTADLEEARLDVIERLGMAAEFRDDATGQHTKRVGALSAAIAQHMGMQADAVEVIRRAAPLHDVGKIAVPDRVLLKPGPLDPDERAIMESHAAIGARLLSNSKAPILEVGCEIALGHHERWDGSGYPNRLAGERIPATARIVAVADFFDALTHDRPYRSAVPVDTVLSMVEKDTGTHFDPDVVDAFFAIGPSNHL
jgi:putative two-component system response regulator